MAHWCRVTARHRGQRWPARLPTARVTLWWASGDGPWLPLGAYPVPWNRPIRHLRAVVLVRSALPVRHRHPTSQRYVPYSSGSRSVQPHLGHQRALRAFEGSAAPHPRRCLRDSPRPRPSAHTAGGERYPLVGRPVRYHPGRRQSGRVCTVEGRRCRTQATRATTVPAEPSVTLRRQRSGDIGSARSREDPASIPRPGRTVLCPRIPPCAADQHFYARGGMRRYQKNPL
jgi:hypothetical protein